MIGSPAAAWSLLVGDTTASPTWGRAVPSSLGWPLSGESFCSSVGDLASSHLSSSTFTARKNQAIFLSTLGGICLAAVCTHSRNAARQYELLIFRWLSTRNITFHAFCTRRAGHSLFWGRTIRCSM